MTLYLVQAAIFMRTKMIVGV